MAILGLGTDIIEIARIEAQLAKSSRLAERVLTAQELSIFSEHKFPARYLAKRFAAKEAAVKAFGTGIGNGVSFQHVQVNSLASGQPILEFFGTLTDLAKSMGVKSSHISISDEQHYAVATVVLES